MDVRAEAIRVGWLDDVPGDAARSDAQERIVRLPIDAAIAAGRIDRPVEFVREAAAGLPFGTAHTVEAAYARLVEQGVVMIAGPAIGDNALVATPLADAARVPTLNWAGTELARGDWMFHLQVGSHEEEPVVLARHMVTRGFLRIAVVRDQSPIGRRYGDFFAAECDASGVRIVRTVTISPLGTGVDAAVGEAVDSGADALVYLGLGYGGRAVGEALAARGRPLPVVCNTCGMFAHAFPEWRELWDGWTYVDMYSDHNEVLAAVRAELGITIERGMPNEAFMHDLGSLLAEGLSRAEHLSREGVRAGLEGVKLLPAAEGHDGTLMSFGRWDRGALKGDFLVLREWHDGRSVEWRA